MHAHVLAISWLLVGQFNPATELAPNVLPAGQEQVEPAAGDGGNLAEPDANVELEPVPESSPGVEFTQQSGRSRTMVVNPMRDAAGEPLANRAAPPSGRVAATSFAYERSAAGLLVRHSQTEPDDPAARQAGVPVSLVTLLDRVSDRSQRMAVVRAYWKLGAEYATANWAAEEVEFVARLRAENGQVDRAEIESARHDSLARWQEARLAVVEAQHELAEVARISVTTHENLPLPKDLPLVTGYDTKFEKIFAQRSPPAGLRQVAATIPLEFELVETRAAAVTAGRDAVKAIRQAYEQGTADLALLVSAQDRLNQSQRAFLAAVRRYNESVARYALAVGGSLDNATLVTMLIPAPTGLRGTTANSATVADRPRAPRTNVSSGRGGAVRTAGDFSNSAPLPRNSTNWAPSTRPPTTIPESQHEAPALMQPPVRFGDPQ